jgi:hypothetical protein
LEASISKVIDGDWLRMDPVRVGSVPPGFGTPDGFVTVTDRGCPVLRVDVYAYAEHCTAFEDAIIWRGHLVVGFGSHVHCVSIADRSSVTIALGSYFGRLHPTRHYLLIASGDRLFRVQPDRTILWTSDHLAVDGVVVRDPGPPIIRGIAEHDPPGDWRPFAIFAADGTAAQ